MPAHCKSIRKDQRLICHLLAILNLIPILQLCIYGRSMKSLKPIEFSDFHILIKNEHRRIDDILSEIRVLYRWKCVELSRAEKCTFRRRDLVISCKQQNSRVFDTFCLYIFRGISCCRGLSNAIGCIKHSV